MKILVIILLLFCGCRATSPMPPKPVAVLHSLKAAGEQVRLLAVVVPAPTTFTLLWTQECEPLLRPFIDATAWESQDLKSWSLIQTLPVETEELSAVVPANGDHGFWKVGWRWK